MTLKTEEKRSDASFPSFLLLSDLMLSEHDEGFMALSISPPSPPLAFYPLPSIFISPRCNNKR